MICVHTLGNKSSTTIIEIVCGVAGGIALLLFIIFIICCCYVRRRHHHRTHSGGLISHRTSHKGYKPVQMEQLEEKGKSKGKKVEERKC